MAQWLKAFAVLAEDQVLFPATTIIIITVAGESMTSSGYPRVPGTHMVHI